MSKSTGQGIQAIGPSVFHQVFDMAVVNLRAPPLSPIQRKDTGKLSVSTHQDYEAHIPL